MVQKYEKLGAFDQMPKEEEAKKPWWENMMPHHHHCGCGAKRLAKTNPSGAVCNHRRATHLG